MNALDSCRFSDDQLVIVHELFHEAKASPHVEMPAQPALALLDWDNGDYTAFQGRVNAFNAPNSPQPWWVQLIIKNRDGFLGTAVAAP